MTHATVTLHMLWIIFKKETLQDNETFKKDILVQMLYHHLKQFNFLFTELLMLCAEEKKTSHAKFQQNVSNGACHT